MINIEFGVCGKIKSSYLGLRMDYVFYVEKDLIWWKWKYLSSFSLWCMSVINYSLESPESLFYVIHQLVCYCLNVFCQLWMFLFYRENVNFYVYDVWMMIFLLTTLNTKKPVMCTAGMYCGVSTHTLTAIKPFKETY